MDTIDMFQMIAADPYAYAQNWKKAYNRPVIGYLCSYTPEEIIHAAGALPFRITGSGCEIDRADTHLQAYSCRLIRNALNDTLEGKLDFLKGTVFPHTCDSIQRLSDIWRINTDFDFHLDVVLPVKVNTESAALYMADVLRKFRNDLETGLGKTITDEALHHSIRIYNSIRNNLMKLNHIHQTSPGRISGRQIHAIQRTVMVMDRKDCADALETLVTDLAQKTDPPEGETKRIVLTGGLCHVPDVFDHIEAAGGRVVADDFCTGFRYADGRIETNRDPIASIASRYFNRVVCPAKHAGLTARGEYLVKLAGDCRAHGVIFLFLKFCDPHSFDYPYLKKMLEDNSIPSILIELENQLISQGQFQTRCEAFMEMI